MCGNNLFSWKNVYLYNVSGTCFYWNFQFLKLLHREDWQNVEEILNLCDTRVKTNFHRKLERQSFRTFSVVSTFLSSFCKISANFLISQDHRKSWCKLKIVIQIHDVRTQTELFSRLPKRPLNFAGLSIAGPNQCCWFKDNEFEELVRYWYFTNFTVKVWTNFIVSIFSNGTFWSPDFKTARSRGERLRPPGLFRPSWN